MSSRGTGQLCYSAGASLLEGLKPLTSPVVLASSCFFFGEIAASQQAKAHCVAKFVMLSA